MGSRKICSDAGLTQNEPGSANWSPGVAYKQATNCRPQKTCKEYPQRDCSRGRRRIWALIAHRLASLGKQVIIVDSRDIGMGSTMASTAILSYEPDVHLIDLISQIGQRSAVRAYRAGIEALDSLEQTIITLDDSCDFQKARELIFSQQSQACPDCAPRMRDQAEAQFRG